MRFLGIGDDVALADMYLRLAAAGHEVRVYAASADNDVMQGLLTFTSDWHDDLAWIEEAGGDGIILFETSTQGELQSRLRAEGLQVIGASAEGNRLELDRAYGQQVAHDLMDVRTVATHHFDSFDAAIRFLQKHGGRYVYKLNGDYAPFRNCTGELDDATDLIGVLALNAEHWAGAEPPDFVLMERVEGVEIGIGAYFNGERFLEPACLDWEHKRFFNGDLGELTGEMGTLVTYRGYEKLFERTLARLTALLADGGYVGYINLNTIVNGQDIVPLEFTSRFGYPGFAILDALHTGGWAGVFSALVTGAPRFRTHAGYALGVALTVPPYPYPYGYASLSKGAPVSFRRMNTRERDGLHYAEVRQDGDRLVSAGSLGYVMVVTGRAETAEAARDEAYALARKVVIPNLRYRTDIGARFIARDRRRLQDWGWLP